MSYRPQFAAVTVFALVLGWFVVDCPTVGGTLSFILSMFAGSTAMILVDKLERLAA